MLTNSTVGTMAAANTATGLGGGIWARRGVTLQASTVEGNSAAFGGDIVVERGNVSVAGGSAVCDNTATEVAGGIAVAVGSISVIGRSQVESNQAEDIGGILAGIGRVTVSGGSSVSGRTGIHECSSDRREDGGRHREDVSKPCRMVGWLS